VFSHEDLSVSVTSVTEESREYKKRLSLHVGVPEVFLLLTGFARL
jgi:hypothetical protein